MTEGCIRPIVGILGLSFGVLGCSRGAQLGDETSTEALGSGGQSPVSTSGGAGGDAHGTGGTSHVLQEPSGPLHHPPPGFAECKHAEVKEDCKDGWCTLPPSCFVMGAPEDEWTRGRYTGTQVAATLTHPIEVQQMEMSRAEWKKITSVLPSGYKQEDDGECLEDDCPINNVTWWEAIFAANMLSVQSGLDPCYEPVNCTAEIGKGLVCEAVAEPEKSVYNCEGYRLGTRAEAEYATKASTYSTWYSGNITVYDNLDCNFDEKLDEIGWYCFNSENRAHPTGKKAKNAFGLYDIIGNEGEWLNEEDRTTAAGGGLDPIGNIGTRRDRQIFGGAYNARAWTSTTSDVFAAAWDIRGPQAGFRLYRTLFEDSERSKAIVSE